jgi:SAM-dependent methyltransferase
MSHSDDLLWGSISNLSRFAALHTMAELGLADHLSREPLSTDELAVRCGAHAPSLKRVLRELAGLDVVSRTESGEYALTERGAVLRSEVPGSIRSSIRMLGEESFWYAMGNLTATVREGKSSFVAKYGRLYDHLAAHPETARIFDDYMTARSVTFIDGLVKRYDFSGVRTLVDVAGGKGHILAAILHANPGIHGTLLDLGHVAENATRALAADGLADRCDVVHGDFFAAVPANADAYLLASILHNWDDDDAVRILRNVRRAMNPGGRVLVLEIVLPDDDRPHVGKDLDMRMLGIFDGGAERSREEYANLLDRAGLKLSEVVELGAGAGLIEATPV